jgi:hypothetical protein
MDSNFQVKVTADISALQASLKNVQADLDKFKKSADGAAAATKAVEANANRGRLVAFAFGQVLRDAGFFAQDFRLGLLAISNNIPILIDQLVLLSGVSKAVGSALSLVGSLLTAGLTIWAYSGDAVKKNKQSIDEWRQSLEDVAETTLRGNQASTEELAKLDLLYKAAINTANSIKTRTLASKQLQELYPSIFGNYSKEEIMLGKVSGKYSELRTSILEAAKAQARFDKIVENSNKILDEEQKVLDATAQKRRLEAQLRTEEAKLGQFGPAAGAARGLVPSGVDPVPQLTKTQGAVESLKNAIKAQKDIIDASNKSIEGYNTQNSRLELTNTETKGSVDNLVQSWSGYNREVDKSVGLLEKISEWLAKSKKDILSEDSIRFLPEDYKQQSLDELADFYGDLQSLVDEKLGPIATGDQITEASDALYVPFDKQKAEENYKKWKENFDSIEKIYEDFNNNLDQIFVSGTVNILSSGAEAIGEALAKGGNIAEAAGKSLWTAFATILQQLGQLAIQTGITIQSIKSAIKSLNPFVAIAAGTALIALAGYIRGKVSNIGNQMSDSGATAFANGGIVSGPTNALVGEYPGARTNPEVIAPLDKLQSIIGSSMGVGFPAGSIIAETKISGNDLSILVKRADKNRGEYF